MSPEIIIIIILCIAAVFVYSHVESRQRRQALRRYLEEHFGAEPDAGQETDRAGIAAFCDLFREEIPEDEQVDDITWNDLEMDRIFDRMNTTQSFVGEQVMYRELHRQPKDKGILQARESLIRYFTKHTKERVDTQMLLRGLKKEKLNYYLPVYMETIEEQRLPLHLMYRILPVTLALLAVLALITGQPMLMFAAGANAMVNIVLYALGKSRYESELSTLCAIVGTIQTAKKLSASVPEVQFPVKQAIREFDKLSGSIASLSTRKQMISGGNMEAALADYLLGMFLFDFYIYDKAIKQFAGKKQEYWDCFQYVGEIDFCIAAASYRQSMSEWCVPEYSESGLAMESVCHPLIHDAVKNDFTMEKHVILTGSNASGKSTFMKAVAVNLILGQTIGTCAAKKAVLPDVRVLTSMAVRDDVMSGESYYMREIRYLERMVQTSLGDRKIFCGIDEILRGTNTVERIAASVAILQYLCDKNCMIMVASHDIELAKTMDGMYENLHFCESVEDGDVVFDYKLKKGICSTSNAIRLLEAVGFPEEIVKKSMSFLDIPGILC